MEEQDSGTPLSSESVRGQDTAVAISPSSTTGTVSMASSKNHPTVEMETITHVFRELLVQYLDARCVSNSLRFELGKYHLLTTYS